MVGPHSSKVKVPVQFGYAAPWFHGPMVMTPACHAGDGGSIPPGTARICPFNIAASMGDL